MVFVNVTIPRHSTIVCSCKESFLAVPFSFLKDFAKIFEIMNTSLYFHFFFHLLSLKSILLFSSKRRNSIFSFIEWKTYSELKSFMLYIVKNLQQTVQLFNNFYEKHLYNRNITVIRL